jgi:hypothetical protein
MGLNLIMSAWFSGREVPCIFRYNIYVDLDTVQMHACVYIVTDLINELPGNSSVNTVQHATIGGLCFLCVVRAERI